MDISQGSSDVMIRYGLGQVPVSGRAEAGVQQCIQACRKQRMVQCVLWRAGRQRLRLGVRGADHDGAIRVRTRASGQAATGPFAFKCTPGMLLKTVGSSPQAGRGQFETRKYVCPKSQGMLGACNKVWDPKGGWESRYGGCKGALLHGTCPLPRHRFLNGRNVYVGTGHGTRSWIEDFDAHA